MSDSCMHKRFGDIATFSRGLTFAKGDVAEDSSKRVLRSNNIDLQSHSLIFDEIAYLKEDFVIPNEKKLHKGDLFICMSNGSTQHLGKVAYVEEDMDYAFGGFMGAIHPNKDIAFTKYAYYACLSFEYRRFLASIFNGVNINNLKWSDLSNFEIPIPSLDEQMHIVAELDLLTGIIDKQKQQLKELDTLAQSIFYDMFGSPDANEKEWIMKSLAEIGTIVSGSTPSTSDESNWDGDVNWVTPAELGVQLFYGETQRKITSKAAKSLTIMPIGTLLMSSRAPIGKLAITSVPMCCNQGFKNIVCGNNVNNIYLYYYLMLNINSIKAMGRGATFKEVSKQAVSSFKIMLPPMNLQESFAKKIQSIESQKKSINRSIAESQKLFDYTMDKYFG